MDSSIGSAFGPGPTEEKEAYESSRSLNQYMRKILTRILPNSGGQAEKTLRIDSNKIHV